jgi:chromosome segregation ATPase
MGMGKKDCGLGQGAAAPVVASETLRSGGSPAPAEVPEEKRIPLVWRIFGGTVLSISALVAVTLYQQLHNKVEGLGDTLVKKEEFFDHRKGVWDRLEKLRSQAQAADAEIQQRCARLEEQAKCLEGVHKELGPEVKQLRDLLVGYLKENATRLQQQVTSGAEERKALVREVKELRERLAAVESRKAGAGPIKRTGYEDKGE